MAATTSEGRRRVRVTKDPAERREELLDIAWELGRAHGFESLRVEHIVQAAGVAKGTFYHYFAAKDDVLEALIQRFADGLFAELERASLQPGGAADKLKNTMEAVAAYKLSQPDLSYVSILFYQEQNLGVRHRLFRAWQERTREALLPVIVDGVADGSFSVTDPEAVADIISMLWFNSTEMLWNRALTATNADDFARVLLDGGAAIYEAQERILGLPPNSIPYPTDSTAIELAKKLYQTLDRNPS